MEGQGPLQHGEKTVEKDRDWKLWEEVRVLVKWKKSNKALG